MLRISTIKVTLFEQNCRVLSCPETGKAVVVDPGGGVSLILAELKKLNAVCSGIWVTHSHLDHCGGVKKLKAETGAALYAHPAEKNFRKGIKEICAMYGFSPEDMEECPEPDIELKGGETVTVGNSDFSVIHSPGHSEGSLCFYSKNEGVVLVGDVLFAGSIGRTDLPGGNYETLMRSIGRILKELPLETKVLSGHGPDTTLEREKKLNQFLHSGWEK